MSLSRGNKLGLRERTSSPREAICVPAGQRRDGDAVARRVDEPAVTEVDPGVVDLRRFRLRALRSEEEDVGRLQLGEGDPFRRRNLAAHGEGRPALQGVGEGALVWVLLDFVDAPDEAG